MVGVAALPFGRPLTAADLDATPDDGHRYELLDGVLVVSPSPSVAHQRVVGNLFLALSAARPPGFEVFGGPLDVVLADDTVLVPDLVVTRRVKGSSRRLAELPLLVIEVLSPSSRGFDLVLKRRHFEAAAIASYWVVDPIQARLIAWSLRSGEYVEVADVSGDGSFAASAPYAVTIVPADLGRP